MAEKFKLWLNVKIKDRALAEKLAIMCESDKRNRSDFVRLLIEKEFEDRSTREKLELPKNSKLSGKPVQGE